MRLLLACLAALEESLNSGQGCGVSLGQRLALAFRPEILRQYIRKGIDGHAHRHGFRIGEPSAVDDDFRFILHAFSSSSRISRMERTWSRASTGAVDYTA